MSVVAEDQMSAMCNLLTGAVVETVASEIKSRPAPIGGRGRVAESVASWKGKLRMVLAVTEHRRFESDNLVCLHRKGGLYELWVQARHLHFTHIRKVLIHKCRAEVVYWTKLARRQLNHQSRQLMKNLDSAAKLRDTMPALAESKIREAFRKTRGNAGIAINSVFEKDDPTGTLLKTGPEVRQGLGIVGDLTQDKFKGHGCAPDAFAAFCDVFYSQQPTISGIRNRRGVILL